MSKLSWTDIDNIPLNEKRSTSLEVISGETRKPLPISTYIEYNLNLDRLDEQQQ